MMDRAGSEEPTAALRRVHAVVRRRGRASRGRSVGPSPTYREYRRHGVTDSENGQRRVRMIGRARPGTGPRDERIAAAQNEIADRASPRIGKGTRRWLAAREYEVNGDTSHWCGRPIEDQNAGICGIWARALTVNTLSASPLQEGTERRHRQVTTEPSNGCRPHLKCSIVGNAVLFGFVGAPP